MLCVVQLLDGRSITAHVGVAVSACRVGIGDLYTLDNHLEWTLSVIGLATSPIDCTLLLAWVTCGPHTERDASWCLRVVLATDSIRFVKCANYLIVDKPGEGVGSPVPLVGDEVILVIVGGTDGGAIPCRCVALAEVVRLDRSGVMTKSFPVNFVKIVRHQNDAGDDTEALRHLGLNLNSAEVDVKVCLNKRSIGAFRDDELSTIGCEVEVGSNRGVPVY